jgi:hypothetical protein
MSLQALYSDGWKRDKQRLPPARPASARQQNELCIKSPSTHGSDLVALAGKGYLVDFMPAQDLDTQAVCPSPSGSAPG